MKQILLVVFVTAMAALGFVVTRKLAPAKGGPTADPTAPAASAGVPPAGSGRAQPAKPAEQAPKAKPDGGAKAGPKQGTVKLPADLAAKEEQRKNFDWRSAMDSSNVVSLEEAWQFDLSWVDFEAPVLLRAGGLAVTREDFRASLLGDLGRALLDSRAARELALWYAGQQGQNPAFTDAEWQLIVEVKAERAGRSVDELRSAWALASGLPLAASEALQRWSQEASLAYGICGQGVAGMPQLFQDNLPEGEPRKLADQMLAVLQTAWKEWSAARSEGRPIDRALASQLIGSTEGFAMFQTNVWHDELAYRLWTSLDNPLPEGAAAALATGPLPAAPVPPPWTWGGEPINLPTDELYALLGPSLGRAALEAALADCLWFKLLGARLQEQGLLQSPETAWATFAKEYAESKLTALPMIFVRCTMEGFPSLRAYRAVTRMIDSLMAGELKGWDDLDSLDEYFQRNRFFIEGWQPQLRVALFPPYDLATPWAPADWERARAEAESLCSRVEAGESFAALQEAQIRKLSEALASSQGQESSREFQRLYGSQVALSTNEFSASLDESIYRSLLRATTLAAGAVAHLAPGEISKPWRTPKGYVVVQLEGAGVGRLENELEDVLPTVLDNYRTRRFQRFVNETLRATAIEKP